MSERIDCTELTECTPACENYGKPIPPNQGTPLCRLIIKYKNETNPVTKSTYGTIIKRRMENYNDDL